MVCSRPYIIALPASRPLSACRCPISSGRTIYSYSGLTKDYKIFQGLEKDLVIHRLIIIQIYPANNQAVNNPHCVG